jgi:hypothetical protein
MNTDRLLYAPEDFAASDPVAIVRDYPFALSHLARKNPQASALLARNGEGDVQIARLMANRITQS